MGSLVSIWPVFTIIQRWSGISWIMERKQISRMLGGRLSSSSSIRFVMLSCSDALLFTMLLERVMWRLLTILSAKEQISTLCDKTEWNTKPSLHVYLSLGLTEPRHHLILPEKEVTTMLSDICNLHISKGKLAKQMIMKMFIFCLDSSQSLDKNLFQIILIHKFNKMML